MFDNLGLVGDLIDGNAARKVAANRLHLFVKRLTQCDDVSVLEHGDSDADGWSAVLPE